MKISIRNLTYLAFFAAAMIALKEAMSSLPNIEPVSLLIIVCTEFFGPQAFLAVLAFAIVEGMLYGFNPWWWVGYLYVWPILVTTVMLLRRWSSPLLWALVSGVFGLLFGTLCSPTTFITSGWAAGLAWIARGIPYDLIHGFGNLFIALAFYYPLHRVIKKILKV